MLSMIMIIIVIIIIVWLMMMYNKKSENFCPCSGTMTSQPMTLQPISQPISQPMTVQSMMPTMLYSSMSAPTMTASDLGWKTSMPYDNYSNMVYKSTPNGLYLQDTNSGTVSAFCNQTGYDLPQFQTKNDIAVGVL